MSQAHKRSEPEVDHLDPRLNHLAMSEGAQPLYEAVKKHIADNVAPIEAEFHRLGEGRKDRWSWAPGQLELLQTAKDKAKAWGLWNFFLPHAEIGRGLTNLDNRSLQKGRQSGPQSQRGRPAIARRQWPPESEQAVTQRRIGPQA